MQYVIACVMLALSYLPIKLFFLGDEGRYQTYSYCNLSNTNNVIIAQSYKTKIVSNSNTKN